LLISVSLCLFEIWYLFIYLYFFWELSVQFLIWS
jgi:hypothetical protein